MASTLSWFLKGEPRYVARSPWPAWLAVLTAVAIFAGSTVIAALLFPTLTGIDITTLPALRPGSLAVDLSPAAVSAQMTLLLMSQAGIVMLTLLAALWGGPRRVLQLQAPDGGWVSCLLAILVMIPVLAIFNAITYVAAPEQMAQDFRFFLEIARSPARTPATLAIGLGAPVSEEVLFRGFLLSALAGTAIGYWRSAVAATAAWTLLHWGYSWVGLTEVFVIGLYLSWLLWRTGSLWPPIICHALYNSGLLLALRLWPVA